MILDLCVRTDLKSVNAPKFYKKKNFTRWNCESNQAIHPYHTMWVDHCFKYISVESPEIGLDFF